jgi:hypothetical protein
MGNELFECRHKSSQKVFTRNRKLPFRSIVQLLLRKSVKSVQLVLNEWCDSLGESISASAYSQARSKLRYTAFVELLEKCVLDVMYCDDDYEKFKGHRLLALDGSTLRLPNTRETREHFGVIKQINGSQKREASNVEAKAMVLYDVLNRVPLSAGLFPGRKSDVRAGEEYISTLSKGDIVLADRAFGSYRFLKGINAQNADFIIRCKLKTFAKYHQFDDSPVSDDRTVFINPSGYVKKGEKAESIRVRFVKVILSTGEIEILATSLLDTKNYPTSDFKNLYHKRWGIETYYHTLKSRCAIDNFTGKSVESIYQDFHSTIFISGLETIVTADANEELRNRNTKHPLQVNKSVSFHAIKSKIIIMMDNPPDDYQQQIKKLFLQSPTSVRPGRTRPPRKSPKARTVDSVNFQRYARKHVF